MYSKDKVLNKSVKLIMVALCISFSLLFIGYLQAADVDTLIQKLTDEDLIVRLHAANSLGEIKDARAIEPLIAALKDKDCGCTAANSLVKIGKPAVEPLIIALKNENPFMRRNAAKALGEIKDSIAVEPLTAALKDESPIVRRNAAVALREMGKPEAVVVDILY